jgi:tRNA pseudouridine55 synthase
VERKPRFVHIYAHQILQARPDEVDFRVVCSKGFYVRTYAFDIGNDIGCGAHLNALRRTKSGRFDVEMAFPAADLKTATREQILEKLLTLPQVSRIRGA